MTAGRSVTWNVFWNWGGQLVGMAAGFVVAPHLVRHLGETSYGLWILIASLTGYFSLLDLGVRGSVGRHIAFYRAKGDREAVNAALSTAVAVLCGAAAVALAVTLLFQLAFFSLFDVPPSRVTDARLALLIVGLNLALSLPLSVFDATLWAFQRFDALNVIDIPATVLRIALTFALIRGGPGDLTRLALITLLTAVLPSAVKVAVSFRLDRGLRLSPRLASRSAARPLLGYGSWYFLLSLGRIVNLQINPVLIGSRLGITMVTPYSIAMRLVSAAGSLVVAATGVLTPVATALHADQNHDKQKDLLAEGGKYCTALALSLFFVFAFLGRPIVGLWIGARAGGAAGLLLILAAGEVLPMSQWISNSVILGMGRHKTLAVLSVAENATVVALALVVSRPYGLVGICVVYATAGTLCRGVVQLVYACRAVGMPVPQYVRRAALPALAASALPASALGAAVSFRTPRTWYELTGVLAAYGACWLVACALLTGYGVPGRRGPARWPARWRGGMVQE